MFILLVTSGFTTVMAVAVVGFLPLTAPSAAPLDPLMVHSTWKKALAATFTGTAILKVTATTFTRERCEWDSGLENVPLATSLLTLKQAGEHCPGSSLKRWQKPSSKHVTGHYKTVRVLIWSG